MARPCCEPRGARVARQAGKPKNSALPDGSQTDPRRSDQPPPGFAATRPRRRSIARCRRFARRRACPRAASSDDRGCGGRPARANCFRAYRGRWPVRSRLPSAERLARSSQAPRAAPSGGMRNNGPPAGAESSSQKIRLPRRPEPAPAGKRTPPPRPTAGRGPQVFRDGNGPTSSKRLGCSISPCRNMPVARVSSQDGRPGGLRHVILRHRHTETPLILRHH